VPASGRFALWELSFAVLGHIHDGAVLFDAPYQVVDEGGLLGGDVSLVEGDGDDRGGPFPAELGRRAVEDKAGMVRVINVTRGEHDGVCDARGCLAGHMGGEGGVETIDV